MTTSRTPHTSGRPDLRVVDVNALEPCTAVSAARQIAAHAGCTATEAEQMVGAYLDEVSELVGVSVHQWGLDPHDLAAILTDNGHPVDDAEDLPDSLNRTGVAVANAEHAAHQAQAAELAAATTETDDHADGRAVQNADGWGS